VEPSGFRLRV